jgi:hypothetical protein
LEHFKNLQENFEFHQNKYHPGMYLTRGGSVQRPLTNGPSGVAGRPNPMSGRPSFMSVWPTASLTRVYTRRGGQGGGESWLRPLHLADRPCGLVGQPPLGELPPRTSRWSSPHSNINTSLPVEIKRHTTFWRFHLQSSHS